MNSASDGAMKRQDGSGATAKRRDEQSQGLREALGRDLKAMLGRPGPTASITSRRGREEIIDTVFYALAANPVEPDHIGDANEMIAVAAYFGDDFVEHVFRPVIGSGPSAPEASRDRLLDRGAVVTRLARWFRDHRRGAMTMPRDREMAEMAVSDLLTMPEAAALSSPPARPEDDLAYAQRLATVAASFFGPPTGWKPLDTMQGVLSQIDNALTGLSRTPARPEGVVDIAKLNRLAAKTIADLMYDSPPKSLSVPAEIACEETGAAIVKKVLASLQPKEKEGG